MDFDLLLYIVLIVGSIGYSLYKNLKEKEETQAKKRPNRPIVVEPADEEPEPVPSPNRQTRTFAQQAPQKDEYFSYETMSDRDFAQEFAHDTEEMAASSAATAKTNPSVNLTFDEEEVYKGIIYSEILKRKY